MFDKRKYRKEYNKIWYSKKENKIKKLRYQQQYFQKNRTRLMAITKEYIKRCPWVRIYSICKQRCCNPNNDAYHDYGGKGIKFLLTSSDIKVLWFRDKAYLMKRPCLSRFNHNKDYKISNVRFLPKAEHTRIDTIARFIKK